MWIVVTPEEEKAAKEAQMREFRRGLKKAEEKRKAREAHEACRCPHCGRNDPLPPWLC